MEGFSEDIGKRVKDHPKTRWKVSVEEDIRGAGMRFVEDKISRLRYTTQGQVCNVSGTQDALETREAVLPYGKAEAILSYYNRLRHNQ